MEEMFKMVDGNCGNGYAPDFAGVDDGMKLFMAQAGRYELLDAAREAELSERIQHGDIDARNELVSANYRLVVSEAKKFRNRGVDFPDLVQYGSEGLIKAAEKYDASRGTRFSTCAVLWIEKEIRRHIITDSRLIRVPENRSYDLNRVNRAKNELEMQLGVAPTAEELAERTGLPVNKVLSLLEYRDAESLNMLIGDDEDTMLQDMIPDDDLASPEEKIQKLDLHNGLVEALATLPDRERQAMELTSGILDGRSLSLDEAGRVMGCSREQVRQLQMRAGKRLRYSEAGRRLSDYWAA